MWRELCAPFLDERWIQVRDGGRRFVLSADTSRPALKKYLEFVGVHGDDIEWRVVESRTGQVNAVAFGPDTTRLAHVLRASLVRRKERTDTMPKTADPDDLTRKLTDVAQNAVIAMHDCGTTGGISKGIAYKGDEIDRPLSDIICGRVSRNTIVHPITGTTLLEENEPIAPAKAEEREQIGIDRIRLRSPMTCAAPRERPRRRCAEASDFQTSTTIAQS